MTNCATLTHEDAFANIKLLEKQESLPKKKIYGFGVDGKRFKVVTTDNNILSKIWYSILKFLKFIKTDEKSINNLKQYTFDHLECNDYKDWAKTHYKVSQVGIKNLIEENEELRGKLKEGNTHTCEVDKEKIDLETDLATYKEKIKDLQSKLAKAQSERAITAADLDEAKNAKVQEAQKVEKLAHKLEKAEKKAKHKRRYKEEAAYYKEGWKREHPDVDIKKYLKENDLYEAIHGEFHKSKEKN